MKKLESYLVNIDQIFKDDRGYIKTLFNLKSNNVSLIFSKKNSIRSNHYHLTDWHYIYVIKGSFEYYYKSLRKYSKIKKILVKKIKWFLHLLKKFMQLNFYKILY